MVRGAGRITRPGGLNVCCQYMVANDLPTDFEKFHGRRLGCSYCGMRLAFKASGTDGGAWEREGLWESLRHARIEGIGMDDKLKALDSTLISNLLAVALREVLATHEKEASAVLSWQNAMENFSDAKPEEKALRRALRRSMRVARYAHEVLAKYDAMKGKT